MDLSDILSVGALLLAAAASWRSDLQGPRVRIHAVPGSTVVRMKERPEDPAWTMVNVFRAIVFVNESSRSGYVASVRVRSVVPRGWTLGNRLVVGIVRERNIPEPDPEMRFGVEGAKRIDALVSWWFDVRTSDAEEVRAAIRDPSGPLFADVTYSSLESGITGPSFRSRRQRIRPKVANDELVAWGSEFAMSVGLDEQWRHAAAGTQSATDDAADLPAVQLT